MMTQKPDIYSLGQFGLFALVFLASFLTSVYTANYFYLLAPLALLGVYVSLAGIRFLFYCLVFFLPLSIEMEVPGLGFSTDFPDEFFMVLLMFLTIAYVAINYKKMDK